MRAQSDNLTQKGRTLHFTASRLVQQNVLDSRLSPARPSQYLPRTVLTARRYIHVRRALPQLAAPERFLQAVLKLGRRHAVETSVDLHLGLQSPQLAPHVAPKLRQS